MTDDSDHDQGGADNVTDIGAGSAPPVVPAPAEPQVPEKRDLKRALASAYNALVLVRVSTVIADVDLDVDDENNRVKINLEDIDKERSIITQHDLLEGDIVTIISTELESNADIREYHAAQVEGALKVLPANLKMLVELFEDVVDAIDG